MKSRYYIILLMLIVNLGHATILKPLALSATVTGGNAVCQNEANVLVTFTGSGGTAPYTFVYQKDGVAMAPVSTTSGSSSVTVVVPTGTIGTFVYSLVSVKESTGTPVLVTGTTSFTVSAPPIIDFTFDNNSTCSGTLIQFTSTLSEAGAASYSWDFDDGTPLVTTANPTHRFEALGCATQNFSVKLTVVKNGCTVVKIKTVIVKQKPSLSFTDVLDPFSPFSNCLGNSAYDNYTITVANNSSTCVSSFSINWGDGITASNVTFPLTHTYTAVGVYSMTITATGTNGCINSKTYQVKNISNPLGGLNSPGSTQNLCAPTTNLQFSISNWGTNSLDTTYNINYGDGATLFLTQAQLISSTYFNAATPENSANYPIPHIYTTSNCPATSYQVTLDVTNACGTTPFTLGNITILTKAVTNFTTLEKACVNTSVLFTNTTAGGFSQACSQLSIFTWNFGDGSPTVTTQLTAPQNISHTYTTPGVYTVTLTSQNICGTSPKTQQICIEPPLTPLFTVNTLTGCAPLAITTTNTTVLTNQCDTPTYLWSVSYAPGFCSTTTPTIPNQTTANASYNFTEAGTYTISFTTTNSCGSSTVTKTVVVKKPPVISINAIDDSCVNSSVNPVAVIPTCATASGTVTYAWSFPGGNPATANTANPGSISYATSGTKNITLIVTNECGASNIATQTVVINPTPTLTNTTLTQNICSGTSTVAIVLAATPSGTTFTWTATATAGISGFTPSGTSATIPAQTITTTNATAGTVTYSITPKIGSCTGTPVSYVITVNPAPTITAQPVPSTVCLNGTTTLLTVVVNSSSGTPTYQWFSNTSNSTTGGTAISGATSNTYLPPTTVIGEVYYYCLISLPPGGCSSLTSTPALVKVEAPPTISTQPLTSQNICVGTAISSPLTVVTSGGTGTASYQWYSNNSNATTGGTSIPSATSASYLPPTFNASGTFYYYVTVTFSGNNCGNVTSQSATINVSADPTTTQPQVSQYLCQGATPASLQVTASGGNGTFSYQWYQNATNNTTSGTLIPGATNQTYIPPTSAVGTTYYYCVIAQPTLGCGVTSNTAAVIINQSPSVSVQPASITACLGGTLPVLTTTVSNGAGTPTYQWFSNTTNSTTGGSILTGETSATFTPPSSAVGTLYYYCSVTFSAISGSCSTVQTNTAEVIITTAATIDQNPLATQSICVGVTVPNPLTATFIGGTGTPTYQWFSNTNNNNSGGIAIGGATGVSYLPPVFATSGTNYFYVAISFSGSGCGAIASNVAEIIVVDDPTITAQPLVSQTLCQNAVPTTLAVTPLGGIGNSYSYQWYSSTTNVTTGGTLISGANSSSFVPETNSVGTVFYYCIISQNLGSGCNVTSNTAQVVINAAPTINAQPQDGIWCINQIATPLSVSFNNGTGTPTYQWFSNLTNTTTGGTLLVGQTSNSLTPSTASAGSTYYYCVITFSELVGGCEIITSSTALITVNPFAIIASENATICSSNSFSIIPSDGNGNTVPAGTTYTWSQPTVNPAGALTGFSAQTVSQTVISQTLINTTTSPATITYTVTPTSGICIGTDFTVSITVNPSINPNVVVTNNACFGVNNASIATNITGGIPPYVITWSGPNGFTSAATSISNIEPGTYTITIDDAGNCPFATSYTITQPDDILITTNSQTNSACFESNNGTIDLSVTGGTGNYTYSWTKNNAPFASSQDLANLSPGTYMVTVTDENNCGPKTETFTITEPPLLIVSLFNETNINCFGAATGVINVEVIGGTIATTYNFAWTGPNGFTSSSQNLTTLIAGTYNLTVTDDNGCQKNLGVTLTQSTEIIVSYTTTEITCYGANNASLSATISGGNAPYTFTWNNLSTVLNQNNLSAGDYIITVTDNLGCIKTATINIPEAPIFTVNPVVQNISCFGANNGSIALNLVGGIAPVTLTWSDGSTAGLTRNNLAPGTYTATINDGKPCQIIRTFIIVQPQPLILAANLTNPTNCTNASSGVVDLIVSGGTAPFTYSWSNGSTTEDLNNLVAGNYAVTVLDANGCSVSGQYSLVRPEPITIKVNTQTDFDCATHKVTQNFIAQASGGIPPFTYQWSSGTVSGDNNQIMNSQINGTVILTVFDSLGCSQNYTVTVDNPEIGYASFNSNSTSYTSFGFYSINDAIQFTSNITGDYESMYWDFGDGTFSSDVDPIHTYTIEKEYLVTQTVIYPFGCEYKYNATLSVEKGYVLVVPTGFSPNSDSINDKFRPVTKNLTDIVMDIYDSWGSLIYSEKGDVIKGWDGKIKGFNAENGNYYSKVAAKTFYGTIVYENQTFVLIK